MHGRCLSEEQGDVCLALFFGCLAVVFFVEAVSNDVEEWHADSFDERLIRSPRNVPIITQLELSEGVDHHRVFRIGVCHIFFDGGFCRHVERVKAFSAMFRDQGLDSRRANPGDRVKIGIPDGKRCQVFFLQAGGHPLEGGIAGRVQVNGEGESRHFCRGNGKAVALRLVLSRPTVIDCKDPPVTLGSHQGLNRSLVGSRSAGRAQHLDSIQFAPLKSQGANACVQYLREPTTPDKPPPCSPKTINSIATRLEIKALRDIAFDDIRSKVTSEDVTIELFLGFASRALPFIPQNLSDLAGGKNKLISLLLMLGGDFNESTTATLTELVKGMKGGKAAYRAGVTQFPAVISAQTECVRRSARFRTLDSWGTEMNATLSSKVSGSATVATPETLKLWGVRGDLEPVETNK
ncbi:hypothetical protein BJ322DRAFT_1218967 [Thelephora terrestris]|uniref:Uncharacterized protein n=1 Tax=Thelephora terrestris TaxID=56493 RepID=A0A9P6HGG0_9AGAM|nr:hypothetical protein BJ322DRAFT_1218967 [Thelephora terrestris]